MTNEIKEKLLKELQEIKKDFPIVAHLDDYQKKMWKNACFIEIESKVKKAIEETSKAKDEEFIKILDKLKDLILKDGVYEIETETQRAGLVDVKKVFNHIEEIKQRIKEEWVQH